MIVFLVDLGNGVHRPEEDPYLLEGLHGLKHFCSALSGTFLSIVEERVMSQCN